MIPMVLINKSHLTAFLLIGILILEIGCNQKNSSLNKTVNKVDSTCLFENKNFLLTANYKTNELLTYSSIIQGDGNYSLEIVSSYFFDSLFLSQGWVFDQNDIVINQILFFKTHDTILKQLDFDVRQILTNRDNGKYKLLDNVIRGVSVVRGKNGWFYKISGVGGCNECSEYSGFFSLKGEILWKLYTSSMDNFSYIEGNYNNVLKEYGIIDSSKISKKIYGTWVFPPQYSGKVYETRLR